MPPETPFSHDGAPARTVFPRIAGLADIRGALDCNRGRRLFTQGSFLVVRTTSALSTTYTDALHLEMRGLVFARDGERLLSRTLHKFFNLHERESLQDLEFRGGVRLETKIDGSMIGAFVHAGAVHFHTRGGFQKQAAQARAHAPEGALALVRDADAHGLTPVFEWTHPDTRIVIAHARPELTLLGVRDRLTGRYDDQKADALAHAHAIARPQQLARHLASPDEVSSALTDLRARTDIEGGVLVFPDGHRIKVKTDDYLYRHKILDQMSNERHAYRVCLDDAVDDVATALGGARGRALTRFAHDLDAALMRAGDRLEHASRDLAAIPGRDRASIMQNRFSPLERKVVFAGLKTGDFTGAVRELLDKRVAHAGHREEIKTAFGLPNWRLDDIDLYGRHTT